MKKIVSIAAIKIGMFVSGVTKSDSKLTVKSQGIIKSQATIDSLVARGILELEIDLQKSQYQSDIQQNTLPKTNTLITASKLAKKIITFEQHQNDLAVADRLYTEARAIHTRFVTQLKSGQAPDFASLQALSQDIIDSVFDNCDALACLVMLKESNDYLIEHSLNCSILMSFFAHHKGFSQAEIKDLTLAGLLMNCGMALLPSDLTQRTDNFSSVDVTLMRTHIDIGIELTQRFAELSPTVADIMANHHERLDQTGYPKQKHADDISVYAKMAAIVDCYDAMLTDRPFRTSTSAHEALELMRKDKCLDNKLVEEFIEAIGLFPVGSLVHLQSGQLAIVAQRNAKDPLKPKVVTFYDTNHMHNTDMKRIDLMTQSSDKIIGSVTPEEFNINLLGFFRSVLLPT